MKDLLIKIVNTLDKLHTKISTFNINDILTQEQYDNINTSLTNIQNNFLKEINQLEIVICWNMQTAINLYIQLNENLYAGCIIDVGQLNIVRYWSTYIKQNNNNFIAQNPNQWSDESEYFDGTYFYLNNQSKIKLEFIGSPSFLNMIGKILFNNTTTVNYFQQTNILIPKNTYNILQITTTINVS